MSPKKVRLRVVHMVLPPGPDPDLVAALAQRLQVSSDSIVSATLIKRSVDCRQRKPRVIATLEAVVLGGDPVLARFKHDAAVREQPLNDENAPAAGTRKIGLEPVVVGAGPAGLFAALALAQKGYRPLLIERGKTVRPRWKDVRAYWSRGELDPESNVVFGEGGAGTFSDGKIYTRRNDPRIPFILGTLARVAEAPDVLTAARPHLGTNRLSRALLALRQELIDAGVTLRFESRFDGLELSDGRVAAVRVNGERIETDALFLGAGHSARDVHHVLLDAGVALEARPFAVGARVEHPQTMIDGKQYGDPAMARELGAASYMMAWNDKRSGLSAHTFCTCPGGEVVAASTEEEALTVNGMSYSHRLQPFCNSAVVVEVRPEDHGYPGVLGGVEFQRTLERAAAAAGGGRQVAPAQHVPDFLAGRASSGSWDSSYRLGLRGCDLTSLLPERVVAAMRGGLREFGRRIDGFDRSGHLIAVEARTTSPVRIVRDRETRESVTTPGLFPIGEGAGHAGGIVSAASDGLRAVEVIANRQEVASGSR